MNAQKEKSTQNVSQDTKQKSTNENMVSGEKHWYVTLINQLPHQLLSWIQHIPVRSLLIIQNIWGNALCNKSSRSILLYELVGFLSSHFTLLDSHEMYWSETPAAFLMSRVLNHTLLIQVIQNIKGNTWNAQCHKYQWTDLQSTDIWLGILMGIIAGRLSTELLPNSDIGQRTPDKGQRTNPRPPFQDLTSGWK